MQDGFSKAVVWLLTVLFVLGLTVSLPWYFYSAWYIWIHGSGATVAGRFDTLAALRISAALSGWVTLTSGLLWFHHEQEASYTTPLEFFFGICFGFFLFITVVSGIPALLGG